MTNSKKSIPVGEKYLLTIHEASAYFNIGIKKLRRIAEDNEGNFAYYMGNRYLIVRAKFEAYIEQLIMNGKEVTEDEETGDET